MDFSIRTAIQKDIINMQKNNFLISLGCIFLIFSLFSFIMITSFEESFYNYSVKKFEQMDIENSTIFLQREFDIFQNSFKSIFLLNPEISALIEKRSIAKSGVSNSNLISVTIQRQMTHFKLKNITIISKFNFDLLILLFLTFILSFAVVFYLINKKLYKTVSARLNLTVGEIEAFAANIGFVKTNLDNLAETPKLFYESPSVLYETQLLYEAAKSLLNTFFEMKAKIIKLSYLESFSLVAKQVSHDIRSPLSALTMITSTLTQIPEEKHLIILSAVSRINDIANTLLEQAKKSMNQVAGDVSSKSIQLAKGNTNVDNTTTTQILSLEFIPTIVDSIVSEKRLQFREKIGIEIEVDLCDSYGSFAWVNSTELKRVLSNLINNSVEAFPTQKGKVIVSARAYNEKLLISVQDNGKGIPKSILEKLGQEGVTHGKEGTLSGFGLGVFHAKKTIESFDGLFQIQSCENVGTLISIYLPRAESPVGEIPNLVEK